MTSAEPEPGLNRGELTRYADRVDGRWPLDRAVLGGARADVHCYTPVELERKVVSLRTVREAVSEGVDLLALA